ncbi:SGNH/GDSL hydrolase family protein [Klebsiella aerogenes]
MATPLPTPTQNPVPSTDIRDAVYAGAMMDLIVSSTAKMYTDRLGIERYTIEGIRQNLIPLGRQYMTLADAQADIANIPVNSTTYVRNADGAVLADEYMNVGGTLQPTGRVMPGSAALMAPNLMQNSRAALTDKLPALFSGADSGGVWAAAGAEMAAQGAVQEVACPPRASTSDRAVNYLFQQDISFVSGGSYIATEMLYRGNTTLIFTRVAPDTAATRISQRYEDLGNGTIRVTTLWKINGNAASPATVIYWGCQQSGSSVTSCEIAYPKIAISRRQIFGVGGDMSMADMLNQSGAVVNNFIYNSFADPRFSLPRLRVGSVSWTLVSTLTNTTIASALTSAGAVSCLVAPPVSSGYVDALVEPWVDETASPGMWGASQYYVYVDSVSGVNPRDEIRKAAVFFIDVDNGTVQVTPDVISQVSNNLFHVRASYQFANKPRRISMGVRQTGANSTFYVFGFFMGLAKQKIRDILESPTRDSSLGESLTGSARNIAFNPSADPAQQQQGLFGGGSWTPVASLPADVQSIATLGAKAAVSALRVTSGYRDALANISLDGVKMGDYVRIEFGVYVNADAGVDIATALTKCCAFFWNTTGAFEQKTAQVKEKINDKTYTMTYQYQYLGADASRVYLGVRNTLSNADFYVFNTNVATSANAITNLSKGLVRDPMLNAYIASQVSASVSPYPPLLAVNSPVANAEDYILLPDQIFVHPTEPLLIQCPQLLMNWTADMGQFLDWSMRGTNLNGRPYSYETSRTMEFDPAKVGTDVSFGFHNRQKPGQWSRRDVTLVRGPATVTASKSISLIGDSLTNRGQVARLTALLTAAGVTVTQIGTMTQQEGGKGEGRESWAAAHFVGKRTLLNSTRINISSDNPSGTNKNPFLFEATEAQKTAHPEMCFLNTGAASEKSYADTQTGTFYTFDYRRYLDAQGFADPDIVSIALAWNDQANGQTPDAYIAQINYMVEQIRVACPNARIAIAPYCHPYSSRAVWNANTSQYVRNVIGSFKGRQSEKLHIIPSWGIMPADTAWSSDGANITRDALTGSYVDTRSDNIHWDQWGRQYMAYNCLYPFYIWACAQ